MDCRIGFGSLRLGALLSDKVDTARHPNCARGSQMESPISCSVRQPNLLSARRVGCNISASSYLPAFVHFVASFTCAALLKKVSPFLCLNQADRDALERALDATAYPFARKLSQRERDSKEMVSLIALEPLLRLESDFCERSIADGRSSSLRISDHRSKAESGNELVSYEYLTLH